MRDPHTLPALSVIADAQRVHPAIEPYFTYHCSGTFPVDLTSEERKAFVTEVGLTYIDGDGVLRRTLRSVGAHGPIILPPQYRICAFRECHDRQGHLGVTKSWNFMRRLYWWPQARADLRIYIRLCRVCRRSKIPHHKAGTMHLGNFGFSPWAHLVCDVYDVGWTSGGYTKVLAFVDQFTRGVLCVPLPPNHTSEDVADAIVHMVMRFYGRPQSVRSDRGSVLIAELIAQLYEKHNVRMDDGTAYHHATVGLCERFFSTLKAMLLTHRLASKDTRWHLYLPLLEMSYNSAVNEATGFSPFFANNLRHPDLALDVLTGRPHNGNTLKPYIADHLERFALVWSVITRTLGLQSLARKADQDMRRETRVSYTPGQQVLLVRGAFVDNILPKGEEPTEGPYTVLKTLDSGNYVLGNLRSQRMHEVLHEERLLPWPTRRLNTDEECAQRLTVARIVGRKPFTRDGVTLYRYRIRWAGWHKRADSWRTRGELQEITPLLDAFDSIQPPEEALENELTLAEHEPETPPTAPSDRRHFRPLDGGVVPPAPGEALSYEQQFPVGAQVEMLYIEDDGAYKWYAGTITRSVAILDTKGKPDLSYSVKFPGERVRSYKISRNSLRLCTPPAGEVDA